MSIDLKNQKILIPCPSCGCQFTLKLGDAGSTKTCPKCKSKIKLGGTLKQDVQKAEREFAKFEKQLKKLG